MPVPFFEVDVPTHNAGYLSGALEGCDPRPLEHPVQLPRADNGDFDL
ncbi:hypothetical protein [Streptomyces sp. N2A]|nr:hypothetical protein [Streptomyces sp. N2A]